MDLPFVNITVGKYMTWPTAWRIVSWLRDLPNRWGASGRQKKQRAIIHSRLCYKCSPYLICGEILFGRRYVLRPDFHALYVIEQRLGMRLGEVVQALAAGRLHPADIRMILREGIRASGRCPPLFLPADANAAHIFLLTGMGFEQHQDIQNIACEYLDWEALFMCATGVLGKSEKTFWQMTYATLSLAAEGHAILRGVRLSNPPSRDELTQMMQQFPDNIMHEEYP